MPRSITPAPPLSLAELRERLAQQQQFRADAAWLGFRGLVADYETNIAALEAEIEKAEGKECLIGKSS